MALFVIYQKALLILLIFTFFIPYPVPELPWTLRFPADIFQRLHMFDT